MGNESRGGKGGLSASGERQRADKEARKERRVVSKEDMASEKERLKRANAEDRRGARYGQTRQRRSIYDTRNSVFDQMEKDRQREQRKSDQKNRAADKTKNPKNPNDKAKKDQQKNNGGGRRGGLRIPRGRGGLMRGLGALGRLGKGSGGKSGYSPKSFSKGNQKPSTINTRKPMPKLNRINAPKVTVTKQRANKPPN